MSSPFPGMDPYLEGSLWATAHPQLSVEIARQLAPKLRPKYVALPNERFVVDSVGYDLAVDYSQPPDVPLPDEAQPWAQECLRLWQPPP